MSLWLALAALLLAPAARAAGAKKGPEAAFLAGQEAQMKGGGYEVKRKLLAPSSDGGKLAAYVFKGAGGNHDRLKVWHLKGRVARLVYAPPSSTFRIELSRVHDKDRLPDLYGGGTRTLAYTTAALGSTMLQLVRFDGHKPEVERTPLPEGRLEDLDQDGRPEVITSSLPLGSNYSIDCGDFHTRAGQNAWRTVVYEWHEGALRPASARHASWFNAHIAQLEGELASMDPRASKQYGHFMGAALAIYFDHAEKGVPRQGWSRFNELFRAGDGDPAGTAACLDQVKLDLRRRLNIPDGY